MRLAQPAHAHLSLAHHVRGRKRCAGDRRVATGTDRFVNLGPLIMWPSLSPSFELHLDLGASLMLDLVRH